MTVSFEYKDIFDDERPDSNILLSNVPSRFVIGILSAINDTLDIRGDSSETQLFILKALCQNFPEAERVRILQLSNSLFRNRKVLFAHRYTVDLINKELIHYKEDDVQIDEDFAKDEYNILKAYIANMDAINQSDSEQLAPEIENAAKLGGNHLVRLMWPHLYKQYEFTKRPDAIIETYRGLALMSYIERHPDFGEFAKTYYHTLGCNSPQEYIHKLLGLAVPNLQRVPSENPAEYIFRIKVEVDEPALEALVITPEYIKEDISRQFDYRGLKEKPLFKFQEHEYLVPHWDYLYNALNLGIIFSFFNNSGVDAQIADLGRFKGIIGKEFSENILFKNTMESCLSSRYNSLLFFDDDNPFNPDCYYRKGNHIFLIEFKDYLLNSEVIQSGSYDTIEQAIREKFIEVRQRDRNKIKAKGVSQLARNLEYLLSNPERFWEIDEKARNKKLKLRNMIIHPVIVQTSIHFDFPALNEYLDQAFQGKVNDIRTNFRAVHPITMIHFDYFFDKLLLFADERLNLIDEVEFYHQEILRRKKKAQRSLNPDDWFQSYAPFSFVQSPEALKEFYYRRDEVLSEIRKCWNIL